MPRPRSSSPSSSSTLSAESCSPRCRRAVAAPDDQCPIRQRLPPLHGSTTVSTPQKTSSPAVFGGSSRASSWKGVLGRAHPLLPRLLFEFPAVFLPDERELIVPTLFAFFFFLCSLGPRAPLENAPNPGADECRERHGCGAGSATFYFGSCCAFAAYRGLPLSDSSLFLPASNEQKQNGNVRVMERRIKRVLRGRRLKTTSFLAGIPVILTNQSSRSVG